jgi:mRNA-degrading endonuclease RelE of RelBE toxin-antitoxin system
MAQTLITPEAEAQFAALPKVIKQRVAVIFERLNDWPEVSGAKALHGDLAGHYRIRTGDWRVQFYVRPDGNPVVEKIGNRDRFYGD